jgi:hypothetical protein
MPKGNPEKYSLKIMYMTDSRNNYPQNSYVFCGKEFDVNALATQELQQTISNICLHLPSLTYNSMA